LENLGGSPKAVNEPVKCGEKNPNQTLLIGSPHFVDTVGLVIFHFLEMFWSKFADFTERKTLICKIGLAIELFNMCFVDV